ncbi:MAG: hypothetical protein QW101_01835 [Ignisphaera sp.]|uniref:Uncharacterized protein n=1 Tax=Ignisphaera aggregans TaxID=334771 RepID=A0A7J3MZ65_9CREN
MPTLPTIIEFKKKLIDPQNLDIKLYKTSRYVLLELKSTTLHLHPPILYDKYSEEIDIALTPFIVAEPHGYITLYSIASDHFSNPYYKIPCNNCKAIVLDKSSALITDITTNKSIKVVRGSIDKGIHVFDVDSIDIDIRYMHPLINHAIYVSNDRTLYKLNVTEEGIYFEPRNQCNKLYHSNNYHRISLCVCDSSLSEIFISNKIYGMNLRSNAFRDYENTKYIRGYMINNVGSIEIDNERNYVYDLKSMSLVDVVHGFKPLSLLENNIILGISNGNIMALYDIEKKILRKVARIDVNKLKDFDVNENMNSILVVYEGFVYVFNLMNNLVYLRLKAENVYSATLVDTFLFIFKKNCIDVYSVDLNHNGIYLEKLSSIPRYLVKCRPLTDKSVVCIDILGRIIIDKAENIASKYNIKSTVLRKNYGKSIYMRGYITSILLNRNFASLTRFHKVDAFSVIADGESIENYIPTPCKPYTSDYIDNSRQNTSLYFQSIPKVYKLLVIDEYVIPIEASNVDNNLNFLTILWKTEHIERRIGYDATNFRKFIRLLKEGYTVFLSSKGRDIDFGFAIDRSNIENINLANFLEIENNLLCVLENFSEFKDVLDPVNLLVVCTNTLLEQKGNMCVDLTPCEKVLYFDIEFKINDARKHIIIPPYKILEFRTSIEEHSNRIHVKYAYGVPHISIPKKCIDLINPRLTLNNKLCLELGIVNHCENVGTTIVTSRGTVEYIQPSTQKNLKIDVDLYDLVGSNLQLVAYESTGRISNYMIPINLREIFRRAYANALKLSKVLGIRNDYKLRYNVLHHD